MRRTIPWLAAVTMMALALAYGQQAMISRLDGSKISAVEIDKTMTRLMKAAEVPGASIAIFNIGKVTYLKAYGFRDEEKQLPLTVNSVMTAASFTKVAFADLVMQLADREELNLDKPIYQYLPKPLPEYPR